MSSKFQVSQKMEIKEVPKTINRIYTEYRKAFEYLLKKYDWDENHDYRLAFLKTFAEGIHQCYFASLFLEESLSQVEWWKKHFNMEGVNSSDVIDSKLTNFDQYLKESLLQKIFTGFESFVITMHLYLTNQTYVAKAIDTSAIYNGVVQECNLSTEFNNLIKILLNLKHVFFNGGIFMEEDEDVKYNGEEFLFTKEYPLPFEYASWEYIEFYFDEIKKFIIAAIESDKISKAEMVSSPSLEINYLQGSEIYKADTKSIEQAITSLKRLDLKSLKNDDKILNEIAKFGHIPYFLTILNPGKTIVRARPNNGGEFSKADELSYVPLGENGKFKRASTPSNTMFYGAVSNDINKEFRTLDENVVLLCEASNLFRNRDKNKNGSEIITFGRWIITKEIPLISIILHDKYKDENKWLEDQRINYLRSLRQFPKIKDQVIAASEFIANEFAKFVKEGENYNYKISAVFTELIMNNAKTFGWPVGGLLYPSLQAEGSGLCVAIHPDWVDECMELIGVLEIKTYKKGDNIATNNLRHCDVDKGQISFELKEIPISIDRASEEEIQMMLDGKR